MLSNITRRHIIGFPTPLAKYDTKLTKISTYLYYHQIQVAKILKPIANRSQLRVTGIILSSFTPPDFSLVTRVFFAKTNAIAKISTKKALRIFSS